MKKILLLLLTFSLVFVYGCGQKYVTDEGDYLSGKHHVEIAINNYGTISVELDADVAPVTVTNFINLAKKSFYDGLTINRVVEGFMIQGGDPVADDKGKASETIVGEFKNNRRNNTISHIRGTISMARASDYDSATSQFFIVHKDSTNLDGQYAAFGNVTKGMEIVDKIVEDSANWEKNDNGVLTRKLDRPIISSIKVID